VEVGHVRWQIMLGERERKQGVGCKKSGSKDDNQIWTRSKRKIKTGNLDL
jgi:hypothetical protein